MTGTLHLLMVAFCICLLSLFFGKASLRTSLLHVPMGQAASGSCGAGWLSIGRLGQDVHVRIKTEQNTTNLPMVYPRTWI